MFKFKDKKDFTLMVKIEKQRLSEKEGYYFHNYEPDLNGTQREINSLLAKEVANLNLIVKDEV